MVIWRRTIAGLPLVDVTVAAGLIAGAAATVLRHSWSSGTAFDLALSCAAAGLVAVRRRAPLVAAGGFSAALLALAAVGQGGTTTWAFVALLVTAFSITSELTGVAAASATAMLFGAAVIYDVALDQGSIASSLVSPLVIVGAPAAAGLLLHRSRAQAARLAQLAAELAEQRDRVRDAAVLGERTRIARELHDVIAHTVGVMVVQAGAAEKLLPPEHAAQEPVHAIRQTGKQAMQELRRVVGLLRTATDEPPEPQPDLEALAALVETARRSQRVQLDIDPGIDLAPGVALTVYRTVQESLTNAHRHAPGAHVHISLHRREDTLHVTVADDGPRTAVPDHSPGYGLLGLSERAALYGGALHAGPRTAHPGWCVTLALPLTEAQALNGASQR